MAQGASAWPADPSRETDLMAGRRTREESRELGRAARSRAARSGLAVLPAEADRADLVELMQGQLRLRSRDLIDERNRRMSESPFAFLRGSALRMADDLSRAPHSGLLTQICGDAHLSNFGVYAAPDRRLVFDVNDFDETARGPFEWDVKRLAASIVVAAEDQGLAESERVRLARIATDSYVATTHRLADFTTMDVWYLRIDEGDLRNALSQKERTRADRTFRKARKRTSLKARDSLTMVTASGRRFIDDPPLLIRLGDALSAAEVEDSRRAYGATLQIDRQRLLDRFAVVDVARKVVGVGSVGLLALLVLLEGRDDDDPLILQLKEAVPSVVSPYIAQPPESDPHEGRRVVHGQQLLQAASDVMLGWTTGPRLGRHLYWRQFRDMKGSFDVAAATPRALELYAKLCGATLARAHAKSGDAVAVAAYMGAGERFASAIVDWAQAYAELTTADHRRFVAAVAAGDLGAELGAPADRA